MTPGSHSFGPYELEERLGAGGMAETFLAVRRGPGGFEQHACVKRILPAFEQDAAFVAQFLEEARVSAALRHANIVQVLDFGVAEGSHYLALELVDGMDLHRLLHALVARGEAVTSGLVSFLALELANALDYAHNQPGGGVVHRDISPSNVLVSRNGEVKLTDFGIAKALSRSNTLTTTGTVKGKVPYMAPEYALSGRFEPRSDLFALGVLLFELLAGRRPFVGSTDLDTLHKILSGERPALGELCPTAPAQLVSAIERLLSVDPNARFASATAFQDALVDVAPPPTARRILGELVRRLDAEERASREPSAPSDVLISEGATAAMTGASGLPSTPAALVAAPHDATRTRLPQSPGGQFARTTPSAPPEMTATHVGPELAASLSRPPSNPAPGPLTFTMPTATPAAQSEFTPASPPAASWSEAAPAASSRPIAFPSPVAQPPRASMLPWIAGAVGALAAIALSVVAGVFIFGGPRAEGVADADTVSADAGVELVLAATSPVDAGRETLDAGAPDAAVELVALVDVDTSEPSRTRPGARDRRARDAGAAPDAWRAPVRVAPPEPPAEEWATLDVFVFPFGEVWIDGRRVGTSPLQARRVRAGRHTIEGRRGEDVFRREVTLRADERLQIRLP